LHARLRQSIIAVEAIQKRAKKMPAGRGIETARTVVMRDALLAVGALFAAATLAGCDPAPSDSRSAMTNPAQPVSTNSTSAAGSPSVADGEKPVTEHTDGQGRKWLGDVPYDVFFDDPLTVAAEGRSHAIPKGTPSASQSPGKPTLASAERVPAASTSGATNGSISGSAASPATATGAGTEKPATAEWSSVVDSDTLDAEVKHIRTDLTSGMQSVGQYNSHYQEIAVSGATLAALAEIVAEDPRLANWKDHAANVRDLSANIHDAAKALGGGAYQATKSSSDQLMDVLDGNLPAGLPAAEPKRDFAQVANRGALMKRMDRAFQRLKKGGTAQQLLKKDAAQATEDASILAVLSRVITVGHYESADDPKYRGHANELTRAGTDLATAAKSGEAPAFADALTRIQKRCDACHADFRF
jgi:hypothetical protein